MFRVDRAGRAPRSSWSTPRPGAHVHFTVANRAGRGYNALLFVIGVAPLYLTVEPGAPMGPGE